MEGLSIIKSFLKVIVNDQSLEAHKINADIPQVSFLNHTYFLLYINDHPKGIP